MCVSQCERARLWVSMRLCVTHCIHAYRFLNAAPLTHNVYQQGIAHICASRKNPSIYIQAYICLYYSGFFALAVTEINSPERTTDCRRDVQCKRKKEDTHTHTHTYSWGKKNDQRLRRQQCHQLDLILFNTLAMYCSFGYAMRMFHSTSCSISLDYYYLLLLLGLFDFILFYYILVVVAYVFFFRYLFFVIRYITLHSFSTITIQTLQHLYEICK